ncbi:hypothetical protein RhiirA1_392253 [Rhizophagus irregularis]|uniref:Uncharacterized protein n=1 Tax=Rhizophagus irregularis TaxID=588596 RepID=A0A2I1EZ34_9GLOM|nr:hypothetical protein RhiirA1_392253 [Rhizophagus irregularis]PKY27379.1 hypothetical protein RhiirB3_473445 [Rhizophagus irregularis]
MSFFKVSLSDFSFDNNSSFGKQVAAKRISSDFSFGNNSSFDAAKRYQVINCGLCATTFDFGVVPTLQTAKNFFCYIANRISLARVTYGGIMEVIKEKLAFLEEGKMMIYSKNKELYLDFPILNGNKYDYVMNWKINIKKNITLKFIVKNNKLSAGKTQTPIIENNCESSIWCFGVIV